MTNTNMNLNNKPFLLKPAGKDYLWGGTRLKTDFHKDIPLTPLAETWECSTHPDGICTVASGIHQGESLRDVLRSHPEYYGRNPLPDGELPILIKLIDAKADLSVQVHPDDTYARQYENGALGKTEMWYVLDAEPGARLIYGFNRDMTHSLLTKCLADDTLTHYLQHVPVQKDDVFYIPAGTVHALGAGTLVAEIQENSNITYRLYDYHRVDRQGHTRPLHIDKALEVLNTKSSTEPRQPMRLLRYEPGCASELLCRCKYFQVERLLLNTFLHQELMRYPSPIDSFQVLLCVEGQGALYLGAEDGISFFKGDCIFLPANSADMKIHGKAQILRVSC